MNIWTGQSRLQRDQRQAFTLVELLVVISIITLLASTTLFTLLGVREDTKERRARAQIARINELIMHQWESYRTRAVPIPPMGIPQTQVELRDLRRWRLNALRELIRMELPDRKADLILPAAYLSTQPALWLNYQRRAQSSWSPEYEQAECLYLILSAIRDGDTTGLDFFAEAEIGDVDKDGMPEILDPWGMPIYFLRWAPGYRSDIQPGDNASPGNGDPFDSFKVDPNWNSSFTSNFVLYPLIVSAGRDKSFDIRFDVAFSPNPYDPALAQLGSMSVVSSDDITNHFLEVR